MDYIVVVGSLNMDFVVAVDRLPAPGQTVLGSNFQTIPGGKGANQACAAGKLGSGSVRTRMIGRVGQDVFGDQLKASLSAAGVDVSFVAADPRQPTGVAMIWVDAAGQNSIVVASGANAMLAASEMDSIRPVFRGAACALFQLETPVDTVRTALEFAQEEGVRTMLDPAPAQLLPAELLKRVDILTPNETEACILLGRKPARVWMGDAPGLCQSLRKLGAKAVVLKLGEQGCFYLGDERAIQSPSFAVEVRDTTAAGDTFNGALAVALAEHRPVEAALQFANAAAALSVTRVGAQASIPTRAEVDAFLGSSG